MKDKNTIDKAIRLVETVWASGLRIADADDIDFIHSLDPRNNRRTALEGVLDYLGVVEQWINAGRPAFGKFQVWWTPVYFLLIERNSR